MNSKTLNIALGLCMAGAGAMAQTTQAPPPATAASNPAQSHQGRQGIDRQDRMVNRLTARLNLTPAQQMRVKGILADSRLENKALAPKLRDERMALHNAIKSDSLAQIDQITQQNVDINAKAEANHLKTIAKIYSILTPDQKAKFDWGFDRGFGPRQSKGA